MGRKSNHLDNKLLIIGAALIQEVGISRFSLRQLAKMANVNLGLFSYYFKDKHDFISKCLDILYSPFIEDLQTFQTNSGQSEQALIDLLLKIDNFANKNKEIIQVILRDYLNSDQETKFFLQKNFGKHFRIIREILLQLLPTSTDVDRALRIVISNIGIYNLTENFINSSQESLDQRNERIKLAIKLMTN